MTLVRASVVFLGLVALLGMLLTAWAMWPTDRAPKTGLTRVSETARQEDPRIAALEKRLAAVQVQLNRTAAVPLASPSASATAEPVEPAQDEDVDAQKQRVMKRHQDVIEAHKRDAVDPVWAPKTAALFQSDFSAIEAKDKLKLVSVDCRTTSCTGTVEWASYGSAVQSYADILHHPFKANCRREILLPEPTDKSAPYRETAFFDCSEWRAESP